MLHSFATFGYIRFATFVCYIRLWLHSFSGLTAAIALAQRIGADRLLYSGLREAPGLDEQVRAVDAAAHHCRDAGLQLLYHNHGWEFSNGAWPRLLETTSAALSFCPDLAWAANAGQDVLALLSQLEARLGAVHLKDLDHLGADADTVPLGSGCVPVRDICAFLRDRPGLDVVAEQDRSSDPDGDVRRNAAFLWQHLRPATSLA
ncbi:MAG: sugar phosphate isomerase/epimerase family protein [Planctomycetota bacterium]